MTAGPRLAAAAALLSRFEAAGRPSAKAPPKDRRARAAKLQASPAGWPVARDTLIRQLRRRLSGRDFPRQVQTSYCGPAAFLYCLLHDRPDIYVAYALSLWLRGEFDFRTRSGSVEVEATRGTLQGLSKARIAEPSRSFISDVDWMTMASLSVSTRSLGWVFGAPHPDDQIGSISYPNVIRGWFTAAGSRLRESTMGLGAAKSPLSATLRLMRHWPDSWIVLQIDSSLLTGGGTNFATQRH